MADDETTDATDSVDATEEPKPEKSARSGVVVPAWALAVVAALAIGGIGYAIGKDSDDSRNLIDPIVDVRSAPGNDQGDEGELGVCPRPFEGRDGQLQPGQPGGNGSGELPGVPFGPGFGPGGPDDRGERGERGDQDQPDDDDQNQDQDEDSSSV